VESRFRTLSDELEQSFGQTDDKIQVQPLRALYSPSPLSLLTSALHWFPQSPCTASKYRMPQSRARARRRIFQVLHSVKMQRCYVKWLVAWTTEAPARTVYHVNLPWVWRIHSAIRRWFHPGGRHSTTTSLVSLALTPSGLSPLPLTTGGPQAVVRDAQAGAQATARLEEVLAALRADLDAAQQHSAEVCAWGVALPSAPMRTQPSPPHRRAGGPQERDSAQMHLRAVEDGEPEA